MQFPIIEPKNLTKLTPPYNGFCTVEPGICCETDLFSHRPPSRRSDDDFTALMDEAKKAEFRAFMGD